MIKISNGRECGEPIRIGTMPKLENICRALMELGARSGLPIDAQVDEVKIGKGLSFGGPQYRCIVVYNREHRSGYYFHVFAVEKHYNEDYVQLYLGGSSVGADAVARFERQEKGFFRDSLLAKAKRVQKYELIYQDRLLELVRPAFEMAARMPDRQNQEKFRCYQEPENLRRKQEEEAARHRQDVEAVRRRREAEELRRKQEEEARRQREQEELRRKQAEDEARRRQAEKAARSQQEQTAAQHQPDQEKVCRHRQETVPGTPSGLREAGRGPAQAHREYIGGSREDCSSYRYRNGTLVWTSKTVEAARKHFSCRKCGKSYEVGKGRGSQRFCCNSCGHLIEVTC